MKNKLQVAVAFTFIGFAIWWLSFQRVVTDQGLAVQWFGTTYGLMALIGSIIGLLGVKKWGGFKTVLGKALTFFSLGLLAQEVGQLTYAYYIYGAKIQIPYPSWGDMAYFGSVLLYICAAFFLTKAVGAQYLLKSTNYKFIAVIVPGILLAVSYAVFLYRHEYDFSHPLTVFLDFGYPIGQAVYISIAITAYLLSRKMLGGVMKSGIVLIILALFIQYIADFTFVYQSSRGTYLAGKFDDFLYLLAYFALASAMVKFHTIHHSLKTFQHTDTDLKPQPANTDTQEID